MAANSDLAAIQARFAAIPAKVRAAVKPAIDKGADELVNRMRYLSPDEDATGALKNSITSPASSARRSRLTFGMAITRRQRN